MSLIALAFVGSTSMPLWWTTNPRNFPDETPEEHFKGFIFRLILCTLWILAWGRWYVGCSFLFDYHVVNVILNAIMHHIMKYSSHGSLICCSSILQTKRHDCVIEFPEGVRTAVFSVSLASIPIWLYPLKPSMKEHIEYPAVTSTSISMLDKGNSFLGQALLRSLESIQHLIYPFFFFIGTILASHVGCWTGLTKPTSSSFWISSLISTSSSRLKLLGVCFTVLHPSLMLSLWDTSCGSRPGFVHTSMQKRLWTLSTAGWFVLSFLSRDWH